MTRPSHYYLPYIDCAQDVIERSRVMSAQEGTPGLNIEPIEDFLGRELEEDEMQGMAFVWTAIMDHADTVKELTLAGVIVDLMEGVDSLPN